MAEKLWEGIPRQEVPWYPSVNYDACNGCQSCLGRCPSDVYEWDDAQSQPVVARPYNCVVYCMGCAKVCPEDAITFPIKGEVVAVVKDLRVKYAA
jgi:NAD-dependent dihydropyrimidine dehydrogenase PreA subunit